MIRKVNAGGGAQLLVIKRAPRLTRRGDKAAAAAPDTLSHTATERIWIKTRGSAGRGLLFYEALMGVERSLDYLRVKARGQQAVKCQPTFSRLK